MDARADVLVVGGGTGGCAAAWAAARSGLSVILTEETDWIGGQFTSQGVPPDEHGWIENFGCTRTYRQLRNAIREELNTRELLVREAKKKGLDKTPEVKNQMDLTSQTVLVRAYVSDWMKTNPIPDAALRKEYETIKSQMGDKEYKVRHILV